MRHDWIFDVLRDLRAYAQTNGLPALALKADEAMRVARADVAATALHPARPAGLHPAAHAQRDSTADPGPGEEETGPASGRSH